MSYDSCKLSRRYILPKNCITVGPNLHLDLCNLWTKVQRTFFLERRRNPSGIIFPILDIWRRSGDIRDQSRWLYKIDRNFACFWPPFFFGGGVPLKFLDLHYKNQAGSDHVSKFHSNRPRNLEELVAKEKNHGQNISPSPARNCRSLRPNDTKVILATLTSPKRQCAAE